MVRIFLAFSAANSSREHRNETHWRTQWGVGRALSPGCHWGGGGGAVVPLGELKYQHDDITMVLVASDIIMLFFSV